jgi:hypothetical protein
MLKKTNAPLQHQQCRSHSDDLLLQVRTILFIVVDAILVLLVQIW